MFSHPVHLGDTHQEAVEGATHLQSESRSRLALASVEEGVHRGSGLRRGGRAAPQPLLLARACSGRRTGSHLKRGRGGVEAVDR